MIISYEVKICRYKNFENRVSEPHFISAENFADLSDRASLMVRAMSEADTDARFSVYSITAMGVSHIECFHGFMTESEFSATCEGEAQ